MIDFYCAEPHTLGYFTFLKLHVYKLKSLYFYVAIDTRVLTTGKHDTSRLKT